MPSATRTILARLRSTSSSVVAHDDTLMRMAVCPCHTVPPIGITERHENLIDNDVVQDRATGATQTIGKARRVSARALNQIGESFATEGSQRRPDLDAARAS